MTLAEWCLFGAVILYLGTLAPAKALATREFDNADPRGAKFYEHPVRKRALGAHVNGIETFPFFAAAVILAELKGAPQGWTDGLALAFLVVRIAFVIAYVTDRPTLRTVLWNVAMALNVGIFSCPATASKERSSPRESASPGRSHSGRCWRGFRQRLGKRDRGLAATAA